jgi:quinol monooxygenase YgiN
MAIRLIIKLSAAPGRGDELAKVYESRCRDIQEEPGCEQFEVFQSVLDRDSLVLLEKWADADALAVHAERNRTREPIPADLRGSGGGEREDYEYNRTR